MNITLSLGDFLMIAALILMFSRAASGNFSSSARHDLRARRQLDAIMQHLDLPEPIVSRPGALSREVLALLGAGRKIEAMRRYREETGHDARQAKRAIEHDVAR